MGRIYSHLCREERLNLARWREAGIPVVEIAARLGRAPSTLYRELARNRFEDPLNPSFDGYYGLAAERMAEKRRAIQRKLRPGTPVHAAVVDRLKAGWTPEQIAGRMRHADHPVRVSHETIYRFAYSREGRSEGVWRHLPRHRRRRRPRGSGKRAERKFFPENSISRRPPEIGERTVFGHWECDLMLFRKEFGQANVTSLVERVSRFTVLLRNNDRCSEPLLDRLIGVLASLPAEARRSVTFDRGTDFSAWARLHEGVGAGA